MIFTLSDAGAVAAIFRAVERNATVGYLPPGGDRVLYGEARYVGGPRMDRDFAAEASADIRDLHLIVRMPRADAHIQEESWLIRDLIGAYKVMLFIPDFDVAAFEAAGGQAAIRWDMVRAIPGWAAMSETKEFLQEQRPERTLEPARPFERGDLIEYVSHATGHGSRTMQWVPAVFDRYVANSRGHVYVRRVSGADLILSTEGEVRLIEPELISAARSWVAESPWEDIADEGDIADLSDEDIVRGIQRHIAGGWAAFREAEDPLAASSENPKSLWYPNAFDLPPDHPARIAAEKPARP